MSQGIRVCCFLGFIYLFCALTALDLHCTGAVSRCGERGPLSVAVCGLPIAMASPAADRTQALGLSDSSSCSMQAQWLGPGAQLSHSLWDPPGPGVELVVNCINHWTIGEAQSLLLVALWSWVPCSALEASVSSSTKGVPTWQSS